jgi:hypothetical protein
MSGCEKYDGDQVKVDYCLFNNIYCTDNELFQIKL